MSKADIPPVPPAGRSDKGPNSASPGGSGNEAAVSGNRPVPSNLKEQDRQGNIKQNTTHQGHQQDR
jgi:hypothetical protein